MVLKEDRYENKTLVQSVTLHHWRLLLQKALEQLYGAAVASNYGLPNGCSKSQQPIGVQESMTMGSRQLSEANVAEASCQLPPAP